MNRWTLTMLTLTLATPASAQNRLGPSSSLFSIGTLQTPPAQLPAPATRRRPAALAYTNPNARTNVQPLRSLTLANGSWTFTPPLPPQELRIHDIISIRVDELARMQSDGEMERRKNSLFDAVLKDWVFLDGFRSVRPAPQSKGDPRIQGQLNQLYRAESEMQTRESLAFNIAAEIVDIRRNGLLVMEAHKRVRVNHEVWEYSLSGICRKEDIGRDNVVLSRNILHLDIDKQERGHVRDGYRRGWFQRWFDHLQPF